MQNIHLIAIALSTLCAFALPAQASLDKPLLQKELQKIEKTSGGSLGVGAYDVKTGDSFYLHRDTPYQMLSVGKLPIAIAVLQQVDSGKLSLDAPIKLSKQDVLAIRNSSVPDKMPANTKSCSVQSLLERTICNSNNGSADVLTRTVGGIEAINKVFTDNDIEGIRVDRLYQQLTQPGAEDKLLDTATPKAICQLLLKLEEGKTLSPKSTETLLSMMHKAITGVNRIKAGVPAGTKVAHKTGTGPVKSGRGSANDVAIITKPNGDKVILAVFLSDAPGSSSKRDQVVAAVSRSVLKATN
ncbi:class A beta-lactamase [Candidatus Obscuribacterales bacterium]|nr:class A beta-lactamase [Candidatus Obscuribacterales bacterium]